MNEKDNDFFVKTVKVISSGSTTLLFAGIGMLVFCFAVPVFPMGLLFGAFFSLVGLFGLGAASYLQDNIYPSQEYAASERDIFRMQQRM